MRTTTKDNITYTYPDANVWKQERILVNVERQSGPATAVKIWSTALNLGTITSPLATYSLDSNGKAVIDITDIVRTYIGSVEKVIAIAESTATSAISSAVSMGYKVVGLINPSNVIIPCRDINDTMESLILPPSFMLKPIASGALLKIECYDTGTYQAATGRIVMRPSGDVIELQNARSLQLPYETTSIEFWHLADAKYKTIALRELDCDKRYAAVKWISLSGVERCNTFEVMKPKTEAVDQFSLMSIDNEYIEIKGRKDGLTLRLDGLSAYDLWYYSDVMFSSNVQVSLDGSTWNRVQVTTKSFTQPDGGANDGKLEIAINWKRYDAVAM